MNEEIISKFEQGQQECVDLFKVLLTKAFEESMSEFYCDVATHAYSDATINFRNALRDELAEEFAKNILEEPSCEHAWATKIRMNLLRDHKSELTNKIIEDLNKKIESLQLELRRSYGGY